MVFWCPDRRSRFSKRQSSLEWDSAEGESPVHGVDLATIGFLRVGLFGNAARIVWCTPHKAKYDPETDSKQVQ